MQATGEFQSLLAQVRKNLGAMGKVVAAIARAKLCEVVPLPAEASNVPDLQEFVEIVERHRTVVCPGLKALKLQSL